MFLARESSVFDIQWTSGVPYGAIRKQDEYEFSTTSRPRTWTCTETLRCLRRRSAPLSSMRSSSSPRTTGR
jgi:hypothetical protein